jgi:hypothetical protein
VITTFKEKIDHSFIKAHLKNKWEDLEKGLEDIEKVNF